jgi:hypothetical protein
MDRQPISSRIRAVYTKLTSPASIKAYRRIRHIVREAAIDAVVVGLCGVVAVCVGVDIAQKGYRAAAQLYRTIYGRLNPVEPQPELLPSVGMARAADEFAAALSKVADVAEAEVMAKTEAFQPAVVAECVPDFWLEPLPFVHTPPIVVGAMWNPVPGRDMHAEVARLHQLQHVPLTLMPAPVIEQPELIEASAPELVQEPEQKPALRAKAKAKPEPTPEVVDLATVLNVPGATGCKRKPRAKTGAGVKAREE